MALKQVQPVKEAPRPEQPGVHTLGNLEVIEAECKFAADRSRGTIVIKSNTKSFPAAIEELRSVDARNLAMGYAASQGVGSPRINGNIIVYPVNSKGVPLDKVNGPDGKPVPPTHADRQVASYRVDVPVTKPLV